MSARTSVWVSSMGEEAGRSGGGRWQRLLFGTVLALAAGFAAWFAASLVAARYLVAPGDGLAGAATVAISGFAAAVVALVAAVVTAWRAPFRVLTTATIIALVCGIGAASLLNSLSRERAPEAAGETTVPGSPTQVPVTE